VDSSLRKRVAALEARPRLTMKQNLDLMSDEELLNIIRNGYGLPADTPITEDLLLELIKQDAVDRAPLRELGE
jgi:hypothetical protein